MSHNKKGNQKRTTFLKEIKRRFFANWFTCHKLIIELLQTTAKRIKSSQDKQKQEYVFKRRLIMQLRNEKKERRNVKSSSITKQKVSPNKSKSQRK